MALEVRDDCVALARLLLVVDVADVDERLELVAQEHLALDCNGRVRGLVLEVELGLHFEQDIRACDQRGRALPLKPLLGLKHTDGRLGRELDFVHVLVHDLERVGEVLELAAVQERRRDLDDGLAVAHNMALDLHRLAAVAVDDGDDASCRLALVADLERTCAVAEAETVREVDEAEQVAVDR